MQQKREKELTDREAAITRKELMAEDQATPLPVMGFPRNLQRYWIIQTLIPARNPWRKSRKCSREL